MSTALAPAAPAATPLRPLGAVLAAVGIPMFMVTLDNLVVTTALPVGIAGRSGGRRRWPTAWTGPGSSG